MPELDDLLLACQNGDLSAFDELFRIYGERIYRLAASILRDDREGEDALQETCLRVFLNIHKYHGQAAFTTWLTAVVVNVCRDRLRRMKLRRAIRLDWLNREPGDPGPDLPEIIHERWQRQRLWASVDRLDDKLRLPVILVYQEGLPVGEAAAILGIPLSTAYSRLNTALDWLRSMNVSPTGLENRTLRKKQC
jgi:RNA polymerase sigma-70 factor (ECF subfamily)